MNKFYIYLLNLVFLYSSNLVSFPRWKNIKPAYEKAQIEAQNLAAGCFVQELIDYMNFNNGLDTRLNPNYIADNEKSIIHAATACKDPIYVKELMERLIGTYKANPNNRDTNNNTPLHDAVINKNPYAADSLIEHGASMYKLNKQNQSPAAQAFHLSPYIGILQNQFALTLPILFAVFHKHGYQPTKDGSIMPSHIKNLPSYQNVFQPFMGSSNQKLLIEDMEKHKQRRHLIFDELMKVDIHNYSYVIMDDTKTNVAAADELGFRRVIYTNPVAFDRLSEPGQRAVIKHEIYHAVNNHHEERNKATEVASKVCNGNEECIRRKLLPLVQLQESKADEYSYIQDPHAFIQKCEEMQKLHGYYPDEEHGTYKERQSRAKLYVMKQNLEELRSIPQFDFI